MKTVLTIETSELNPATASVLRRFSRRRRRLIWIRALAVGLLSFAVIVTILMLIDYRWLLPTALRLVLSAVAYVMTASAMWWTSLRFLKHNDQQQIAKQLESVDPRLREDLLSAVELSGADGANGSYEFRERLQRVVARRAAGMDVAKLLPLNLLRAWMTGAIIVACLGMILLLVPPLQFGRRIARSMLPGLAIERASITQVEIVRPDPASGFVARGDAVGITAEISNLTQLGWGQWVAEKGVWLQYRTGDSPVTEIEMTPRTSDFSESDAVTKSEGFSANLMIGEAPVRYRIIAGDAVTLWNTLTPQSRPRVGSFVKEYDFPVYAQLPIQTVHQDHGDLRAIAGTRATVTVEFDEPVTGAVIRVGNHQRETDLISIDGSMTRFKTIMPIESSSQYQVDAVSRRSGLSNPFGQHYSIVPLIDSPPIVRWDESMPANRIVSPIEVVTLSAEIVDDLPIERVLQKTVVNGKQLAAVPVDLKTVSRRPTLSLQWDLVALGQKLSVGDIVQTRLVAIDRRGQMSDSEILEFLIAEEGFDSRRHDSLDRLHHLCSAIHDWFKLAKPSSEAFDASSEAWEGLQAQTDAVIAKIETELSITATADDGARIDIANPMEQIGTAIVDWRARAAMMRRTAMHQTTGNNEMLSENDTGQLGRELESIDEQARTLFSHALTVGLIDDAISIRRSLRPLLDPTATIPATHYPRHLNALASRLDAIETLIGSHSGQLRESTLSHIGKWSDWSDRWGTELRDLSEKKIESGDDTQQILKRLTLFVVELKQQTRHSLLDGRLVSSLSQNARELDRTTHSVRDTIGQMVQQFSTIAKESNLYQRFVDDLLEKVSSEGSLHRQMPEVDLRYAADLNLVKNAIKAVNRDGFVTFNGESAEQVHEDIASAIGLLTAVHRVESGRRNLARLASAEERLSDTALARIDHPAQLERFSIRMEHTVGLLKKSGVERTIFEPIDQTRFGTDYSEARSRITRRRWSEDPIQSATLSLGEVRDQLKQSLKSLKPLADGARNVLLKYAPTIAELAKAAAQEAQANKTTTQSDEVVEALHDFANTADLMESDQRELARDADSASAQIQAAQIQAASLLAEKGKVPGVQDDDFNAALQQLAEVLLATAEHFDNAQNGNDLSKSREELRRREQELDLDDQLDQLTKRTESIAEAAAKTPQELLEQLEKQLQRNEAMQGELSDISNRTQSDVERDLARLAEDENGINQSLEASDPEMQERKRRVGKELAGISRKLQTIQESLVAGAQRSSDWGNLNTTREDLSETQSYLANAKVLLGDLDVEKDPLVKIHETAKRAADAITNAANAMKSVAEIAMKESDQDLHRNEDARIEQQQSLQRFERDARRTRISGQRVAESLWRGEQRSAKRRVSLNTLSVDALIKAKQLRAERAIKAAEDSEWFAKQRIEQAIDDRKKLEGAGLEPLDKPNPAAQLTQRFAATALEELQAIKKLLGEAAMEMDASDDLLADPEHANKLGEPQSRVSDKVQRATDDLRRISRHQERLGQRQRAEELSNIADQIEQGAKVATKNAESDLHDVSKSPEQSPQANRQIAAAAQEIASVGQRLSIDEGPDAENRDVDHDPQPNRSVRQLAKTLDDLDRSIAKSQSNGSDESNPDQPHRSAGEASPTLSSALQSIAQQIARRRQQSTKPGESGNQLGEPGFNKPGPGKSRKPGESTDPSAGDGPPSADRSDPSDAQGMPGEPPGGPSVPIDGVDRQGSDWGQLRSRNDQNTGQPKRGLVPNQYRREIEAYFHGIARDKRGKR